LAVNPLPVTHRPRAAQDRMASSASWRFKHFFLAPP
jgi:hypothetical protein